MNFYMEVTRTSAKISLQDDYAVLPWIMFWLLIPGNREDASSAASVGTPVLKNSTSLWTIELLVLWGKEESDCSVVGHCPWAFLRFKRTVSTASANRTTMTQLAPLRAPLLTSSATSMSCVTEAKLQISSARYSAIHQLRRVTSQRIRIVRCDRLWHWAEAEMTGHTRSTFKTFSRRRFADRSHCHRLDRQFKRNRHTSARPSPRRTSSFARSRTSTHTASTNRCMALTRVTSLWLCIVWEPRWRWRSDCSGETFHTARFLTQKLLSHVTKLFPFHILQNYISEIVKRLCACGETTCCHKFVPHHRGELFIEIGDPLYVESEQDDLWSKGKWKLIKFSFKLSNKLHNG